MNALRPSRLLLVLGLCTISMLALVACSAPSSTTNNENSAATGTTKTTTTNTNGNAATSTTTTATTGDKIGVPECDAYLEKYETCLNTKVPEAQRTTLKAAFEQTRNAWRASAATPEGRASLAQACETATDAAKRATAAYGCSW